jgi:hypothetical protein
MTSPAANRPRINGIAVAAFAAMVLAFGVYSATHSVDFPVYHRVAAQIVHGDYEIYPTAVYSGEAIPPHGFRYAPAIAFLFVPFGWLPLEVAAFLFFALKVGAVVYVGSVVGRYVGYSSSTAPWMLAALLLAGGYFVEEFRYGNFHFFCIALMVFAFCSAASGHTVRPAVALGIAIAAKLTPVVLLAYFAWRRRFGLCLATLAVLAAIALLPSTVVGYRMNNHLLEGFAKYAVQKIDEGDNYALRGWLLSTRLSPEAVTRVWVATVAIGALVVLVALRPHPVTPSASFAELCIVLIAMLLASPHTQRRYFIALYVPILFLLARLRSGRDPPETRLIRLALAATALTGTILPLLLPGRRFALAYEAYTPHFFGGLVMLAALVLLAVRTKSADTRGERVQAKAPAAAS